MQSAPAMDFASIGIEPAQHEIVSAAEMAINTPRQLPEPEFVAEDSGTPWQPAGSLSRKCIPSTRRTSRFSPPPHPSDPALDLPAAIDESNETSSGIQPFEVEFNSAPSVGEIEVEAIPELEADTAERPSNRARDGSRALGRCRCCKRIPDGLRNRDCRRTRRTQFSRCFRRFH